MRAVASVCEAHRITKKAHGVGQVSPHMTLQDWKDQSTRIFRRCWSSSQASGPASWPKRRRCISAAPAYLHHVVSELSHVVRNEGESPSVQLDWSRSTSDSCWGHYKLPRLKSVCGPRQIWCSSTCIVACRSPRLSKQRWKSLQPRARASRSMLKGRCAYALSEVQCFTRSPRPAMNLQWWENKPVHIL